MDIKETVIDTIATYFEKDPKGVTIDSDLIHDIGCDSLDIVELVMELEVKLDIEINTEETTEVKTVGELIELIEGEIK